MKHFPAFLLLIKTNFDKLIALFVDSKFECTKDMSYVVDGEGWIGKLINK